MTTNRRSMLLGLSAASLGAALPFRADAVSADVIGRPLTPWRQGCLDIHHIATGRGDSSLILCPDGTTIMLDAGAMYDKPRFNLDLKPNATRRPGEWIGRYALRRLRDTKTTALDYLIITHIHPDHLGDIDISLPASADGRYRLTGVSDVAAQVGINVILDRGYPGYENVGLREARFAQNYRAFIAAREAAGGKTSRLQAGSNQQITPRHGTGGSLFEFQNLAVNGMVWSGEGQEAVARVPTALAPEDQPDENFYSAAFRLRFGGFRYFAGGDLTSDTLFGELPWRDIETPAAQMAGRVDVAVASHHGLQDGTGPGVVRALRPRVWIIPVWHVSQPNLATLEAMYSERLYQGPRDVFATRLSEAAGLVTERLSKLLRSTNGNIVIRVAPDAAHYHIIITDNEDETDRVIAVYGPYTTG